MPRLQANLIGVNVSKPFTALHGSPFFLTSSWRFRAVMSTARAAQRVISVVRRIAWREATRRLTVARDVCVGVRLGDVSAGFANDEAKLNCNPESARLVQLAARRMRIRLGGVPSWCATIPRGISSLPPDGR